MGKLVPLQDEPEGIRRISSSQREALLRGITQKDLKQLIRKLSKNYPVEISNSTHLRIYGPKGVVTMPLTARSGRSVSHARPYLRKAGIDV